MDSEQKSLIETVTRLLEGDGHAGPILLVRHSARSAIERPDLNLAYTARLTSEGRELAWEFGRNLARGGHVRLCYSPVPRCVDTAHLIRRGIIEKGGRCELAGSRDYLEAPFVRDPVRVMEAFVQNGTAGFAREWASGNLGKDVIDDVNRAGCALLEHLETERKKSGGAMTVCVTHDLSIVALLSLVLDVRDPGFAWPGYLGGTILSDCDQGLCLHYGGIEQPVY